MKEVVAVFCLGASLTGALAQGLINFVNTPSTLVSDGASSGVSGAGRAWKVRLLFAREVATYIGERVWHPGQGMRRHRNGALELWFETSSRKDLPTWILSWVPYIRVLAPRELRERVRKKLRQGLARCR